nr:zinc finger MYM-type protein 1-like [Nothobranchius furzeri]
MADKPRKYNSGALKRKKKKEKGERDKEVLQKIPKLTGFFKPLSEDGAAGSSLRSVNISFASSIAVRPADVLAVAEETKTPDLGEPAETMSTMDYLFPLENDCGRLAAESEAAEKAKTTNPGGPTEATSTMDYLFPPEREYGSLAVESAAAEEKKTPDPTAPAETTNNTNDLFLSVSDCGKLAAESAADVPAAETLDLEASETTTSSMDYLFPSESDCGKLTTASASGPRIETLDEPYSTDPACWGKCDASVRAYWAERGPQSCQHMDVNFKASERVYKQQKRFFSRLHFKRRLANGEYVQRQWLLYSPSTGAVFCFACCIFSDAKSKSCFETGFSDWKHATNRMKEHENSEHHRKSMLTYITLGSAAGRIDSELEKQFESESAYWTEVLRRIVSVVKFLAERGLALRGSSHVFGRTDNGNYLGLLELISEFDPF